ncbi:hypothetical protein ABEX25_25245 [Paenibacillus thiaminolyticus]|uniref:hypothetical protein n=1 Tax=Paenibacillus thiaminolyticus TaxID=49283 RepID=UPI003D2E40F7
MLSKRYVPGADLSVTLSDAPAIFEQLSKIAPTVVFPYHTFGDTRDEIRTFGEMLGKEKEAKWAIQQEIFVYSFGIWRGVQAVYKHLELTLPPAVPDRDVWPQHGDNLSP